MNEFDLELWRIKSVYKGWSRVVKVVMMVEELGLTSFSAKLRRKHLRLHPVSDHHFNDIFPTHEEPQYTSPVLHVEYCRKTFCDAAAPDLKWRAARVPGLSAMSRDGYALSPL
jgi:hypothetical protein